MPYIAWMIQRVRLEKPSIEADTGRQRRVAWEADRIAEADADIDAGRLVDSSKVKAWIDSIGSDHESPVPYSDR